MKVRYFEKRDTWWLDFKDSEGERHRIPTGATTLPAAEKLAPTVIAKCLSKGSTSGTDTEVGTVREVVIPKLAGLTLRQAFRKAHKERESWLDSKDKGSKETDFKGLTGTHESLNEDMDCSVVTRALMQQLRAFWMTQPGLREGSTLSNSTINHRLSMASVLLEVANCPPHTVKHLTVKNNKRKRRVREDELQAVGNWCLANHHRKNALDLSDLLLVGLHTTSRLGDLLALKWADVYLDNKQVLYRNPKNGEAHTGSLSPVALAILRKRFELGGEGPFTGMNKYQMHALWRSAREAIGLGDDHEFVFHVATRHEGLSRLGESGATAFQMKAFSGHKSIAAMDRYVKPSTESLQELGKKIDRSTNAPQSETIPDAGRMH